MWRTMHLICLFMLHAWMAAPLLSAKLAGAPPSICIMMALLYLTRLLLILCL